MTILEIYEKYTIPETLQRHQLYVASVAAHIVSYLEEGMCNRDAVI